MLYKLENLDKNPASHISNSPFHFNIFGVDQNFPPAFLFKLS